MNEKELIESGIVEVSRNGEVFVKETGNTSTKTRKENSMENQDWAVGLTEEKAAYAKYVAINQVFSDFLKRKHGIDCQGTTKVYKDGKLIASG